MSRFAPCDIDEEEVQTEQSELSLLVEEYDELYSRCMDSSEDPLPNEELKELNEIYESLLHIEYAHWDGVSDEIVAAIHDQSGVDFPTVRHILGIPQDHN